MRRIAVVLFNLGGPDGPGAVRPFLYNLFSDPAIIPWPAPFRQLLAALISRTREKAAKANYALMGGASPLAPETEAQARALETALAARIPGSTVKAFVAMRYWRPMSDETAAAVEAFAPDEIVLLPLYPQFSTTTTASSLKAWAAAYRGGGRARAVCCYPTEAELAEAHARRIEAAWREAGSPDKVRLLFSAHGLPQKVVDGGDPYQAQIEATAAAVVARLEAAWDWSVCYQSRVGPMAWIGPATPDAIAQAAREGLGVVVAPIAFVSEHVETLVELDHEYAALAADLGCPAYVRVPALGVDRVFIDGLARIAVEALARDGGVRPAGDWACAACWPKCARDQRTGAAA
ncbi:ferrochelatase [Caulobacter sp. CCUG 60055]|nr:ferrochelatase [Caulobacteraceae bacterium]MCI3179837.1 ferrochelatase [Caulobacter sp. CCUG 60055]